MSDRETIDTYRVGVGPRNAPHWAWPWHVDRFMRSWQAEWEDALWCPRSWTEAGARRKALRWKRRNIDLKKHERRYGRNDAVRALRAVGVTSTEETRP